MRKLFAKAQDPISCETHALGAVAALGGGLLYLLRGVWTDAAIPAVAAALCFCLSMAALYAASAAAQTVSETVLPIRRGNFYDRIGRPLTGVTPRWYALCIP